MIICVQSMALTLFQWGEKAFTVAHKPYRVCLLQFPNAIASLISHLPLLFCHIHLVSLLFLEYDKYNFIIDFCIDCSHCLDLSHIHFLEVIAQILPFNLA